MSQSVLLWSLIAANLVLLFMVAHDRWFLEEREGRFLLTLLDAATQRVGQIFVVVSILVGLYAGSIPSTEALEQRTLNILRLWASQRLLLTSEVVLTIAAFGLAYLFLNGARFFPKIAQGSSSVLITPDGAELYIARENDGVVSWQDLQAPRREMHSIEIGQNTESKWTPGKPAQLAYVPQADQILVTDLRFNSVVVISRRTHQPIHTISGVGFAPRSIVVTPDGHKAYVASEEPIPTGQIAVIELLAKPYPQLDVIKISVPSPEGMAVRGRRLYVATQSGAGQDAIFVVNTATDRIVNWVPGFAVGIKIAVVGHDGRKLYVSRGNALSVLNISRGKLVPGESISLEPTAAAIAVADDGRTALVANGSRITAIDTEHDKVCLSTPNLGPGNVGIAVSQNRAYAWIQAADRNQLYLFDIRSLLPPAP
jgi:DNA-binding beta-propeller fold protein YncE